MPFPLLALAALLSGGGILANQIGAQKRDKATAGAMSAERERQSRFTDQSYAANQNAVERFEDFSGQQDARASELAQLFTGGAAAAMPDLGVPAAGGITNTYEKGETEKGLKRAGDQGEARARLLSLGDLFGSIGQGVGRDKESLNQITGFQRGSQNVLPFELDAAAQKGQGWGLAGDLLGGAGSIATMGALSGATIPGIMSRIIPGLGGTAPVAAAAAMRPLPRPPNLMSLYR